jgi:hypothetical protein
MTASVPVVLLKEMPLHFFVIIFCTDPSNGLREVIC